MGFLWLDTIILNIHPFKRVYIWGFYKKNSITEATDFPLQKNVKDIAYDIFLLEVVFEYSVELNKLKTG